MERVKVKEGKGLIKTKKYTFRNPDGSLWEERFEDAREFREGLAAVKLEDGWTFVDENHTLWEERFDEIDCDFGGVMVDIVYLYLPNHEYIRGIAAVKKNGEKYLIDHDKNMCSDNLKYRKHLYFAGSHEHNFLTFETDLFKDESFVKMAVCLVKRCLVREVEAKEEVDDAYVKHCNDVLSAVEEKIKEERAKIERHKNYKPKSDKNREELIKKIKNFEATKELK